MSIDLGKLAKPEGYKATDVSPAGTTLSIVDEEYPSANDEVHWIGQTKGWNRGRVEDTCSPIVMEDGTNIICAIEVVMRSGDSSPVPGDSGAPAFTLSNGQAELLGIVFARNEDDNDTFYISKIGHIYGELGSGYIWDTCVSGC